MPHGSRTTGRSQAGTVRANLIALGTAEAIARLAQLLMIVLLGRVLGAEGLGIVGVAWAIYQLGLPFVQSAPELMGIRDVARGEETSKVLAELTAVKLTLAVVATALTVGVAATFFADDPRAEFQVMAQGPLLIAVALSSVWAFRGLRRFADYAVVRIANSLALLVLLAGLLWLAPAPWVVPVAETVSGLLAAALALSLLRAWRSLPAAVAKMTSGFGALRPKMADSIQFGLGSFFAGAIWSAPLLVGRAFLDPVDQGHLAACLRLMLAINALFQLCLQVFHPVLSQRYATDRAAGRELAAALVVYAFVGTLPISGLLMVLAPWIVPPMLGADFADASGVLAILATSLMPTIVGSVFGYMLMADGRYRLFVFICAGGAAFSVVGCAFAFYVWPQTEAVAVLTLAVAAVGAAAAVAASRLDLVDLRAISWRQLAPTRIRAVLQER